MHKLLSDQVLCKSIQVDQNFARTTFQKEIRNELARKRKKGKRKKKVKKERVDNQTKGT